MNRKGVQRQQPNESMRGKSNKIQRKHWRAGQNGREESSTVEE